MQGGLLPQTAWRQTMAKQGGVDQRTTLGRTAGPAEIAGSRANWQRLTCSCQVRGQLVKPVKMPDGITAGSR